VLPGPVSEAIHASIILKCGHNREVLLNIETLFTRARQTAGKALILKAILISAALLCAYLPSVQNADALSVQYQFGFGDDSDFKQRGISYIRSDLNIFLYDGELFDVFVGGEHASSEHQPFMCFLCSGTIDSSYEYNAATLGVHVKPFVKRRVNPYLMLGVLSGTASYSASVNDSYANIISLSRDKASFTTYRTGLGLNIVVVNKLAIEIEANYSGGVPAAYATVVDPGGATSNRIMFDGSHIINIALGVRYYF